MTDEPVLPGRDAPPLPPYPGELTTAGEWRLFVRRTPVEAGAEPAVFVHGLGGASTNWTDLMYLLAPRLAGAAPDLPGFGRSDPPTDGSYALSSHVAAVIALLESDGRGPVHLFGNSLGGAVATSVAATRPDLVRTLTLVAPALPILRPRRTNVRLPLLLVPGIDTLLTKRLSTAAADVQIRRVIELCYADPSLLHPARITESADELLRRQSLGHAQDAFIGSLRGLVTAYLMTGPRSLWRQAARVSAPTLLIFGRKDRLVDIRVSARAARAFPQARLLVLDDIGHVAQMETPQTVAEAVRSHLDTVHGALSS